MNQDQKNRLKELRWKHERDLKRTQLDDKLKCLLSVGEYKLLSYPDSDKIQLQTDDWPSNKWEDHLYFQTPVEKKTPIDKLVSRLIQINTTGNFYLFFLHYNFGLVEVTYTTLACNWSELIEIDGDEIFCFIPGRTEFICIEKAEDTIVGQESKSRQWIYEVTFSSKRIKEELQPNNN